MSRLTVPIGYRTLWHTGDVLLRADLFLLIKDRAGNWRPQPFRVDSGTEITTMSAFRAKQRGFPMPAAAAAGVVHRQTGLEVRSGYLRFRIAGLDATEYVMACFFLGDPDTPHPRQGAQIPRRLLQPLHLLGDLRFTFDRNATPAAPYGTMTVEKKTP